MSNSFPQFTMFTCCAVIIAIIQYCNFCQLSFWMRSSLATLAGITFLSVLWSPPCRFKQSQIHTSIHWTFFFFWGFLTFWTMRMHYVLLHWQIFLWPYFKQETWRKKYTSTVRIFFFSFFNCKTIHLKLKKYFLLYVYYCSKVVVSKFWGHLLLLLTAAYIWSKIQ